jgi:two-component system response regulator YesN
MLLEDNSQRKLVIQDIAEIVNLSSGRLAHLFRDEMGTSVQQYLTQIRLAKAKRQLESGFLSIKEIAAAVGFCNVNQFTNTFKTANGITPTQYRQLPRSILPERKDLAIARSANE